MDFSKIKKIFYIVAIISMLLSIKSRVFAATPSTFFNEQVVQIDSIQITNDHTLTPINFLSSSSYDMYTIIVKTLPNEDVFEGYGVIVHKGDTLKIQYSDKKNGSNRAYPTLIFSAANKVCVIPFSISLNNYLQENYDNRMNDFSTSSFWWDTTDERTFAGWSFFDFSNSFPNNVLYSSNSYIDFYNNLNEKIDGYTPFTSPFFDNKTEIENGYPDGVFISRGDFSENDTLYFHLLKITNTVPDGNQSTYYYDSKIFKLTKDSKYYYTYDADTDNKYSYYYIKRSALTLDTNSSYLYVLSNNGDSISNSYGILQPDISGGIYDVVESDTAGVITEQQALNDKISNINNNQQDIANSQQEIANNSNNINNYLNQNTISNDTNENIDTNLNFDNTATNFSNMYGSFFSRLSSTISNLGSYDLSNIETINLPIPFSQKTISLTSNMVSQHMPEILTSLFTAFWLFIFSKYFLAYILYIYTLIASGRILDNINSNNEIITNDVL